MIHTDKRTFAMALSLAALAGYVDALGFISMGGFFVSFMSGNSTRLGVSFFSGDFTTALIPAVFIALFVTGVVAGSLAGHYAGKTRVQIILGLVSGLLLLAGALQEFFAPLPCVMVAVMAMGAINTLFEKDGEVRIALTYMTGTLVKAGQRLAGAILGTSPRFAWLRYLSIWAALVSGAGLGTAVYAFHGLAGNGPRLRFQ